MIHDKSFVTIVTIIVSFSGLIELNTIRSFEYTISELTERMPVSSPPRLDFKYVYRALCSSRNNAICNFLVFILCNFCECVVLAHFSLSLPQFSPRCMRAQTRLNVIRVCVITTNPKKSMFNKFRRCNRFPVSKVDPFFIGYGRSSVDQNLASRVAKRQV